MATGSQSQPDPELVAHERTYKAFNILLRWCMVMLASVISGLTLWFATPAGFAGRGISVCAHRRNTHFHTERAPFHTKKHVGGTSVTQTSTPQPSTGPQRPEPFQ